MSVGGKGTNAGGAGTDLLANQLNDVVGVIRFLQNQDSVTLIGQLDDRIKTLKTYVEATAQVDQIADLKQKTQDALAAAQKALKDAQDRATELVDAANEQRANALGEIEDKRQSAAKDAQKTQDALVQEKTRLAALAKDLESRSADLKKNEDSLAQKLADVGKQKRDLDDKAAKVAAALKG